MRIVRTVAAVLLGVAVAVPLGAAPAWAHNSLTSAQPAKNAVLTRAPKEIRLTFLQKPDSASMSIKVTDAGGQPVAVGAPEVDGMASVASITGPLRNGVHTITYRVVSRDGHPVQGSYRFTLDDPEAAEKEPSAAPAASTAPATATPLAVVPAAGSSDDSPWSTTVVLALPVITLAIGLIIFWLARRGRRH
ncbi:copper resistance CopC family protein [Jidongwangia harbinensis]|uniref:copper resistance CopC family protein n=1 Tax=Jidongwangia harbinensis TaxID=2878561 RepID=UPI001CD9F82E|nr:copper resistance CopC family protein [Jidongwangia harbinensis]MCA2213260.1 copper resistance protein CopC [Jidongwangia harbinensis]